MSDVPFSLPIDRKAMTPSELDAAAQWFKEGAHERRVTLIGQLDELIAKVQTLALVMRGDMAAADTPEERERLHRKAYPITMEGFSRRDYLDFQQAQSAVNGLLLKHYADVVMSVAELPNDPRKAADPRLPLVLLLSFAPALAVAA